MATRSSPAPSGAPVADIDLKTALSVFSKFPPERVKLTLLQATQWATDRISDGDLPARFAAEGMNAMETSIAVLAVHHHGRALREMGPGRIETVLNFAKVLAHKAVGEDKIVHALRQTGFREEDIREALHLLVLLVPGQILAGAEGRGRDEFSVKMRERFSLYLDGFLLKDWVARMALARMALAPEKTAPIRILLRVAPLLEGGLQTAKPFWWEGEHERMLHDALLRRLPQILLDPLAAMADTWSTLPEPSVLTEWLAARKALPAMAELFPLILQPPSVPPPRSPWSMADETAFGEGMPVWAREALGLTTYFQFESRGSSGWKNHSELAEALAANLLERHVRDGRLHVDGYSPEGRDLALQVTIMAAHFPVAHGPKIAEALAWNDPANLSLPARLYRTYFD